MKYAIILLLSISTICCGNNISSDTIAFKVKVDDGYYNEGLKLWGNTNARIIIDWGDQYFDTLIGKGGERSLIPHHKYIVDGEYQITITGEVTGISLSCNLISDVDLTGNKKLKVFVCSPGDIPKLDLSRNRSLTHLSCDESQMIELNVSVNKEIEQLTCRDNQISTLDLSNNKKLEWLICEDNFLTELDVTANKKLDMLDCGNNEITNLNLKNNEALTSLSCYRNKLTELDFSQNPKIHFIECSNNFLSKEALEILFRTLPVTENNNMSYVLYIDGNPGAEHCDRSVAVNKGWLFESTVN